MYILKCKILEYHKKGLTRTQIAYILNMSFSTLCRYMKKHIPELKGKVNRCYDTPNKGVFVLMLKKRYLSNWGILGNDKVDKYLKKTDLKMFMNIYHAREYIKNNQKLEKNLAKNGFGIDDIMIKYISKVNLH